MHTILEYMSKGILPSTSVISEGEYLQTLVEVGIPLKESNFKDQKISEDELEKLQYHSKINKALMTQKAKLLNVQLVEGYNDLIDEEQAMIDGANGKYDTSSMQDIVTALTAEKDKHVANIEGFTFSDVRGMLNGIQQNRINSINEKMRKNDFKLKTEYEKMSTLNKTMQNASTSFKINRTQRRMARVAKKIEKLREKQGRLIETQRQIISEAAAKYMDVRRKEMEKYGKSVNTDRNYVSKTNDIEARLQAARNDLKLTQDELNGVMGQNVDNKFRRSLERDERRLTNEVSRLERQQDRLSKSRNRQERKMEAEKLKREAEFLKRLQSLRSKTGTFGPRVEAAGMSM